MLAAPEALRLFSGRKKKIKREGRVDVFSLKKKTPSFFFNRVMFFFVCSFSGGSRQTRVCFFFPLDEGVQTEILVLRVREHG